MVHEEELSWFVSPGQSYWVKAAAVKEDELGRQPTEEEVRQYWLRLLDANRPFAESEERLLPDDWLLAPRATP